MLLRRQISTILCGMHVVTELFVFIFVSFNEQFARLVREALCELELPYILRNAGKGSSLQPTLLQLAGSTQV